MDESHTREMWEAAAGELGLTLREAMFDRLGWPAYIRLQDSRTRDRWIIAMRDDFDGSQSEIIAANVLLEDTAAGTVALGYSGGERVLEKPSIILAEMLRLKPKGAAEAPSIASHVNYASPGRTLQRLEDVDIESLDTSHLLTVWYTILSNRPVVEYAVAPPTQRASFYERLAKELDRRLPKNGTASGKELILGPSTAHSNLIGVRVRGWYGGGHGDSRSTSVRERKEVHRRPNVEGPIRAVGCNTKGIVLYVEEERQIDPAAYNTPLRGELIPLEADAAIELI